MCELAEDFSSFKSRSTLLEECEGYVDSIVRSLMKNLKIPRYLEPELKSAGYVGLCEASERYDASLGQEFKRYAFLRVRGAIIDSLRSSCELSCRTYRIAKALKAFDLLREDAFTKYSYTKQEISLREIKNFASKGAVAVKIALTEDNIEQITQTETAEDKFAKLETGRLTKDLVKKLPDKERFVIENYYFNDLSIEAICELMSSSKSWISKLHSRGLELIRDMVIGREDDFVL